MRHSYSVRLLRRKGTRFGATALGIDVPFRILDLGISPSGTGAYYGSAYKT